MKKLVGLGRGSVSFAVLFTNTVFWCIPFYAVAILKLIFPVKAWRHVCDVVLIWLGSNWIMVNNWNLWLISGIRITATGLEGLDRRGWYLVLSNHQSWSDILTLQYVFNRKIPFLKFFIKQELIWVPLLGLAWWALDYPFMKRYSKKALEKRPELKGKDLETTRAACEKFKTQPVSIMNFVEGTRFTAAKQKSQESPYAHLLKPKAAGIGFVIAAMSEMLSGILDVTIAYPAGARGLWGFICGETRVVKVAVKNIPVTAGLVGDYSDPAFRESFQAWINGVWAEKDARMQKALAPAEKGLKKAG